MKKTSLAVLLAWTAVASAQTMTDAPVWTKTPVLYSACRTIAIDRPKTSAVSQHEAQGAMSCVTYLAGVYGGIKAETSMRADLSKRIGLVPGNSPICFSEPGYGGIELAKILVAFLDENTELMQLPPNDAFYLALLDKNKCPR